MLSHTKCAITSAQTPELIVNPRRRRVRRSAAHSVFHSIPFEKAHYQTKTEISRKLNIHWSWNCIWWGCLHQLLIPQWSWKPPGWEFVLDSSGPGLFIKLILSAHVLAAGECWREPIAQLKKFSISFIVNMGIIMQMSSHDHFRRKCIWNKHFTQFHNIIE